MMKNRMKTWVLAVGALVLLSGCTQSNIVKSEAGAKEPDFNMYQNIELDMDQLHGDVNEVMLNEEDFPMGSAVDFNLDLDNETVDVTVVVKDGTTPEDTVLFADQAVKAINDAVATQDFSYGESGDETFGGLYQDNVINLKIYDENGYKNGGETLCDVQVPKDTYAVFEIDE